MRRSRSFPPQRLRSVVGRPSHWRGAGATESASSRREWQHPIEAAYLQDALNVFPGDDPQFVPLFLAQRSRDNEHPEPGGVHERHFAQVDHKIGARGTNLPNGLLKLARRVNIKLASQRKGVPSGAGGVADRQRRDVGPSTRHANSIPDDRSARYWTLGWVEVREGLHMPYVSRLVDVAGVNLPAGNRLEGC